MDIDIPSPDAKQRVAVATASRKVRRTQARQSSSAFRAIQIGFFVLIVTVVAAGLWSVVQQRPQASGIPAEVAGFRLVRSVDGPQALQMVAGLHQGSPQLNEAWIAYYEQGGIIWAGTTASPDAAREELEAMAQAIGKGGTPFSNPQAVSLAGRSVFTVSDRSTDHYFFQNGAQVIWITPPAGGGTGFVEAILRKF